MPTSLDARPPTVARTRRRKRSRTTVVSLMLAAAGFLALCVSVSLGDVTIPLPDVVRALFGGDGDGMSYIVRELRLPRALVAVLAGAALGLSGAIFQSLVRNPLASPDIIGITGGASAAAVVALLLIGLRGFAVSLAAFAGALATAAAIYVLTWRKGVTGYRLVLVGVAMGAMLTSIVSYCLTRADVYDAREALVWLTGSLNAKTWTTVQILGLSLALIVPLALLAGRWLLPLELGDDTAQALGVPLERARMGLIVTAVALAAAATAAVGPVAFVAFVSGPIARRLAGGPGIALVPSALVGALVMTVSDLVAQHAFASVQFPVGVVTAIVGAPYLLWLLAVTNRVGRGG
ncbi:iron ABC transporter [Prauserella sp. PE36]|uniref:Iron ABC transporter permease n=1 Tax=Prauserella endophytica TaxID=1592324 RepID=A0ABY2S5P4_9PSEU|nr:MULTISPECIES: iron chelate uptake ABC transporter family permease subunit [Prauserella]PXY33208.1 iron ABC transporter [Prauserella coralliicola]RBM16240.1 iron ABC transporter [Prauserella sp. PE36]TKG70786.1 iron ABC transporter permease [Prauserella endophytica]